MSNKLSLKVVLLPFVYFYVLSFMLVLISAYWLIATPGQISQTYAQTEGAPEADIAINVSDSDEGAVLSATNEYCAFGDERAKKIDAFFTKHRAPLAGEGCNFVREGEVNDIEPNLVAAIAMCESTGGKRTPQFNGVTSYNAWGWAVYDSVETIRDVQGHNCDSWEHCIGRVSRGIASKSAAKGLLPIAEEIVTWYTPASVIKGGGDPEKAPWTTCVKGFMNQIAATHISSN